MSRLRSAEGHLAAVRSMVARGEPPEQVLHQLCAVRAALSCAGRSLLLRELRASADLLRDCDSAAQRAREADRLSRLFALAGEAVRDPER